MNKKYNGLRSYSNSKKLITAPEKIVRGGKTERLSYINDDEASGTAGHSCFVRRDTPATVFRFEAEL